MKIKKIKLSLKKGGMRTLSYDVLIVENTLDENYKFLGSEELETLHDIHLNYEWINREKEEMRAEIDARENLFRNLCTELGGKQIKSNIFGCVIKNTAENRKIVVEACLDLQKKLNKEANL